MKYAHVAQYVSEMPWAILRSKLDEIEGILQVHMAGQKFTPDELRARLGDATPPAPASGKRGAVAVLPLRGVISHRMGGMTEMSGGMSTERFAQMFREAMADESVASILIDVDSPGGTIAGVTELANEIRAARGTKPITAHINALGASAAYWIASAASEVVATPSAMVGSIGVVISHLDDSKRDEREGVTRTVIAAGKYKAEGYGPLSDETKSRVQARVDRAYAVMTRDIAKARAVTPSAVREGFGEGGLVSADEAKALGMIDRVATFEDTLARMMGRRGSSGLMRAATDVPADSSEGTPTDVQAHVRPSGSLGIVDTAAAIADLKRDLEDGKAQVEALSAATDAAQDVAAIDDEHEAILAVVG